MGIIAKPNTFSASTTISSSQVNANFDTIYNDYNGAIAAANLATDSVTTAKIAASNVTTAKIADSAVDYTKVASGMIVQVVTTNYSAVATGTTTIPSDDTIPQITEGTEFMTQAITPKSSSNLLIIELSAMLSSATSARRTIGALFQDATANALAADEMYIDTLTSCDVMNMRHSMTAGTTSSTTFRFRAGAETAGATITFNGYSGTRKYGGVTLSSIKITEIKV